MVEKPNQNISLKGLSRLRQSAIEKIARGRKSYEGDPLNFFNQRKTGLRNIAEGIIVLDRVEQTKSDKEKLQGK
jgi:hypothetical protein